MEITGTFYCSNCSKNTSLILGNTRNAAGKWWIYKELDLGNLIMKKILLISI